MEHEKRSRIHSVEEMFFWIHREMLKNYLIRGSYETSHETANISSLREEIHIEMKYISSYDRCMLPHLFVLKARNLLFIYFLFAAVVVTSLDEHKLI